MLQSTRDRVLPTGLTGLAGVACAACCAVPLLLAAGLVGGAGWVTTGRLLPAVALALVAAAAGAWWWRARQRRHAADCATAGCDCGGERTHEPVAAAPVRETVS